jgi:hypothetical protein
MSPMTFNIMLMIGMWAFGFLAGRLLKIGKYELEIEAKAKEIHRIRQAVPPAIRVNL